MKNIMKKIKERFKTWWKKHIVDDCPPHLDF